MNNSIIHVIERMLNHVDPRLMDHGRRVAYLTYKVLKQQGTYDEKTMRDYIVLALLHDVGAYKTEEIDNMVQFETGAVWEHSTYGYLFIKYFSPLRELAPAILFHHATCNELSHLHPSLRRPAQIIHVADRFDILSQTQRLDPAGFKNHLDQQRDVTFESTVLDMFFHPGWERLFDGMEKDAEFERLLHGAYDEEATRAFITMIVLSVDFRSPQTVTHSITSTCVCQYLAHTMAIDPHEADYMYTAPMLHDIGKVGIPLSILEKAGRLNDKEMDVMKRHVSLTETILSGVFDETVVRLAARHHEKLDGSGYPHGLTGRDLTMGQRLLAVADIFSALWGVRSYKTSFSKEKVLSILFDMAERRLIDADIVRTTAVHYDRLVETIQTECQPILSSYERMQQEYADLLINVKTFAQGNGQGTIAA